MKEVLFRIRYKNHGIWEFVVGEATYHISTDVFNEIVNVFRENRDEIVLSFKDISGLEITLKMKDRVSISRAREYLELCEEDFKGKT